MLQTPSTRAATRRPGSSRQAKLLPTTGERTFPERAGEAHPSLLFSCQLSAYALHLSSTGCI